MKAFLLAAGFGERLKPLTDSIPKPLIPVNNIPSICYAISLLKEAGVNEIMCNLHYKPDMVIDFFKRNNYFNMNIKFSIENEILGTGGGLKLCEEFFDEDFIVINSDIITDIRLKPIIDKYRSEKKDGIIALYKKIKGTVSVTDGDVSDFKNHFKKNILPEYDYMGIAVLSPVIFKYLEKDFSSIVYTGFTGLIENHSLGWSEHIGIWSDIGTIESLKETERMLKQNGAITQRVIFSKSIPV